MAIIQDITKNMVSRVEHTAKTISMVTKVMSASSLPSDTLLTGLCE